MPILPLELSRAELMLIDNIRAKKFRESENIVRHILEGHTTCKSERTYCPLCQEEVADNNPDPLLTEPCAAVIARRLRDAAEAEDERAAYAANYRDKEYERITPGRRAKGV